MIRFLFAIYLIGYFSFVAYVNLPRPSSSVAKSETQTEAEFKAPRQPANSSIKIDSEDILKRAVVDAAPQDELNIQLEINRGLLNNLPVGLILLFMATVMDRKTPGQRTRKLRLFGLSYEATSLTTEPIRTAVSSELTFLGVYRSTFSNTLSGDDASPTPSEERRKEKNSMRPTG